MKILIFAPYSSPHTGGVENYIDEFANYSVQHGFENIIFAPRIPFNTLESEKIVSGIQIIRYPAFEIVRNYPIPSFWSFRFWKLLSIVQKEKPERIISHTRFFFSSFLALLFAKIHRIPWVHIEHGSNSVIVSNTAVSAFSRIYDFTLGRLIFRLSDKNISISSDVQKFIQKFDCRHSPIIHRGIIFEDDKRADSRIPTANTHQKTEDTIKIVSAGRLTKWKGFREVIIAVQKLPKSVQRKIQYEIIGDGEERDALKDLKRNTPAIHMSGMLSRSTVRKKFLTSDIFIHASLPGGGLATTLLEAMSAGCAAIATPYEGAVDVIQNGENGILLENASSDTMRNAITTLINDKEKRERIAKAGRISVRKNFSWETNGPKLIKAIKNLPEK